MKLRTIVAPPTRISALTTTGSCSRSGTFRREIRRSMISIPRNLAHFTVYGPKQWRRNSRRWMNIGGEIPSPRHVDHFSHLDLQPPRGAAADFAAAERLRAAARAV